VRGLDYYTHTAFEFTTSELGAQGAVLAGGRYDGLIETLGGPATPGIGWAAGVERLAMMLTAFPPAVRPVAVVPVGAEAETAALALTQRLRHDGFTVELGFSGNLSKRMKRANKISAAAAVILGEDELARGVATVRDLDTGEQGEAALASLADRLARYR
jgi:histidyl-tRNA synthetase